MAMMASGMSGDAYDPTDTAIEQDLIEPDEGMLCQLNLFVMIKIPNLLQKQTTLFTLPLIALH